MSETVKLSVANGVATIVLNRPHVMNAMDGEMMQQLRPIAEAVEKEASGRHPEPLAARVRHALRVGECQRKL